MVDIVAIYKLRMNLISQALYKIETMFVVTAYLSNSFLWSRQVDL